MSILRIWLQIINEVKVTHQGQGHIKVKIKYLLPFQFYAKFYLFQHIILYVWLQVINKVKFIHQGEDIIKVKVKCLCVFRFCVARAFCKRVLCVLLDAFLFPFEFLD